MAQRIQLRRGPAAEWASVNPVLGVGEPGVESDTGKMKLGDGTTPWNSRPYASKGDKGDPGPAGIADDASVAQQVTNGTATKAALTATYDQDFWNALRHGVKGDGAADDGAATNAFLAAATAAGKTAFFPPNMVIRSTVTITPPANAKVMALGATFRCETPGSADELLGFLNVSNIDWTGGTFDGNKAAYATATEWRHAVNIIGSSSLRLRAMTATNAKGDGFYVGDDTAPCRDILFQDMRGKANARNGLALIAVKNFRDFGSVYEEQDGIHPMAGLDIEPNQLGTLIDQISFTSVRFINNKQYGAMVSLRDAPTVRQGGITFTDCIFDGNGGKLAGNGDYNVRLHNPRDVRFFGGQINNGFAEGVYFTGSFGDGVHFFGTEIAKNGKEGMRCAVPMANLELVGARVHDNSQAAPGTYDGIGIEVGTGVTVIGTTSTGASQRYGLRTLPGVSKLTGYGNNFDGNGTGNTSFADDITTRMIIARSASRLGPSTVVGQFDIERAAAGDSAHTVKITGDAQPRLLIRADGDIRIGDGTTAGDVRLYRSAPDTLRTNDNMTVDKVLTVAETLTMSGTAGLGYAELREQTAAVSNPVADRARIYLKDNGAGKTQMVVKFATGADIVLATEA